MIQPPTLGHSAQQKHMLFMHLCVCLILLLPVFHALSQSSVPYHTKVLCWRGWTSCDLAAIPSHRNRMQDAVRQIRVLGSGSLSAGRKAAAQEQPGDVRGHPHRTMEHHRSYQPARHTFGFVSVQW